MVLTVYLGIRIQTVGDGFDMECYAMGDHDFCACLGNHGDKVGTKTGPFPGNEMLELTGQRIADVVLSRGIASNESILTDFMIILNC